MSLINTMLRDLNARHAAEVDTELPEDVRPLATSANRIRRQRLRVAAGVLLGLGVVAGIVWLPNALRAVLPETEGAATTPAPTAQVHAPAVAASTPPGEASAELTPAPATAAVSAGAALPQTNSSAKPAATPRVVDELPPLPSLASVLPLPPPREVKAKNKGGTSSGVSSFDPRLDSLLTFAPERAPDAAATDGVKKTELNQPNSHVAPSTEARISITRKDKRSTEEKLDVSGQVGMAQVEKVERSERGDEPFRNGVMAYHQGRLNEAISQIQQALRENPQHVTARQALLRILVEQRRYDDAINLLRAGLSRMPEQMGWVMAIARIQVERGAPEEAWATLEKYQAAGAQNAEYQGFAAVLLQHLKKPHEAVSRYKAALRLKPNEGRWWYALGIALEADKQPAEAMDAYRQAQSLGGLTQAMNETLLVKLRQE